MSAKSELQALVELKQTEVAAAFSVIKSAVDSLPEEGASVEELQKKIADLELAKAELEAKCLAQEELLKSVDAAAKAIDASIPDA